MNEWLANSVLWLLASPVLFVRAMARGYRRVRFLQVAATPAIRCKCGQTISLVGAWRCSCGYSYKGHVLRDCPVCYSLPLMVRCYACGMTTKLPEA